MSSSELDHTEHRNAEVTEKPPLSPPRCQAHTSKVGLANFVMATDESLQRCKVVLGFGFASFTAWCSTPDASSSYGDVCSLQMHESAQALLDVVADDDVQHDTAGREKNRAPHCLPPFHPPPQMCPCATHPATPRSKGTKSQVTGHPLPRP